MGNVERSNAGSGVHWAPCGCDSARRLEALSIPARKVVNELKGTLGAYERDLRTIMGNTNFHCLELRRDEMEYALNPPPPSSTAPDQGEGDKFDAMNADEDRMVELEGALEFYADNDNWERFSDGGGGHMPSDAMIDEGEVARRALEVKP